MALLDRKRAFAAFAWFRMLLTLVVLTVLPMAAEGESEHDDLWRIVSPANMVIMALPEGQVIIELNPDFAPLTVKQFKRLVRAKFYDGQSFYRVIDGFVAQGGDGSDMGEPNAEPTIPAEFERNWSEGLRYAKAQSPDLYAPETGFVDGFAVGGDAASDKIWLTHCPGAVAMARGIDPDTSSTDFYVVIGQAPRYLDRNMNLFGRVVYGMDVVQRLRRGSSEGDGLIDDPTERSTIRSIRMAGDLDPKARVSVAVMDTSSTDFKKMLKQRRDRKADFFHSKPPSVLDVCQVPNRGRREELRHREELK